MTTPLPRRRVRGSATGRPIMALLDLLGRRMTGRILWELRDGRNFLPDEAQRQMRDRTRWGDATTTEGQQADVEAAASGTENDHGFWRWRLWWPQW